MKSERGPERIQYVARERIKAIFPSVKGKPRISEEHFKVIQEAVKSYKLRPDTVQSISDEGGRILVNGYREHNGEFETRGAYAISINKRDLSLRRIEWDAERGF